MNIPSSVVKPARWQRKFTGIMKKAHKSEERSRYDPQRKDKHPGRARRQRPVSSSPCRPPAFLLQHPYSRRPCPHLLLAYFTISFCSEVSIIKIFTFSVLDTQACLLMVVARTKAALYVSIAFSTLMNLELF